MGNPILLFVRKSTIVLVYNIYVLCARKWESLYYGWNSRSTIVLVCIIYMYCVLGNGKIYNMVGTQDQPLYCIVCIIWMYCVLGNGKIYTIVGTPDQPLYWYIIYMYCRWWETLYYCLYSRSTIVLVYNIYIL